MRAKMSVPDAERPRTFGAFAESDYTMLACDEARAILAESEPWSWQSETRSYTGDWRSVADCGIADSLIPLALAESLRAFVDAPIPS